MPFAIAIVVILAFAFIFTIVYLNIEEKKINKKMRIEFPELFDD